LSGNSAVIKSLKDRFNTGMSDYQFRYCIALISRDRGRHGSPSFG
jgi:hypothetical protein